MNKGRTTFFGIPSTHDFKRLEYIILFIWTIYGDFVAFLSLKAPVLIHYKAASAKTGSEWIAASVCELFFNVWIWDSP